MCVRACVLQMLYQNIYHPCFDVYYHLCLATCWWGHSAAARIIILSLNPRPRNKSYSKNRCPGFVFYFIFFILFFYFIFLFYFFILFFYFIFLFYFFILFFLFYFFILFFYFIFLFYFFILFFYFIFLFYFFILRRINPLTPN